MSLFEIKSLRFKFPANYFLLDDINLIIPYKSFFSIIGRNASGKSTLIKLLSGIYFSYTGDIIFDGKNLRNYDSKNLARKLAYLPQQNMISGLNLTVNDFLFIGRYSSIKAGMIDSDKENDIINYTLSLLNIIDLKTAKISELSGGQLQKVLIALCLCQLNCSENMSKKILIMDEPLTHLDIHYQFEIFTVLCKLIEEKELTVISVIHDLNLALKFTTNAIVMERGKIVEAGFTKKIINSNTLKKYFNISGHIVSDGENYHLNVTSNGL